MANIRRSPIWPDPRVKPPFGAAQITWGHPLAQGLSAYFPMNESGGRTVHNLVNNQNGSLVGPVWTPSLRGAALLFDSVNDYIGLAAFPLLSSGVPFAISWWEQITANTNAYPGRFILDVSGSATYFLVLRSTDVVSPAYAPLTWGASPGTSVGMTAVDAPSVATSIGVWRHWVITGTNPLSSVTADHQLYVDGISYATSRGSNFGTVVNNRIGYYGADNGPDAIIDNVAIYNGRQLSSDAVRWLFTEPYAFLQPVIRRRWFVPAAAGAPTGGVVTPRSLGLLGVGA